MLVEVKPLIAVIPGGPQVVAATAVVTKDPKELGFTYPKKLVEVSVAARAVESVAIAVIVWYLAPRNAVEAGPCRAVVRALVCAQAAKVEPGRA